MTIDEAIKRVDRLKPNRYKDRDKVEWLAELDGQIYKEILLQHEVDPMPQYTPYVYTEESDGIPGEWREVTLLVPHPYSEVYMHWLSSKIDIANNELHKYSTDSDLFNAAYKAFGDYYTRTHMPVQNTVQFQL